MSITILHPYSNNREENQRRTWDFLSRLDKERPYKIVHKLVTGKYGYDNFLAEYWGKSDILVIEQDIVPTISQVDEIINCKEEWCAFKYRTNLITFVLFNIWFTSALGFTKISRRLQQKYPSSLWVQTPKGNEGWRNIDQRVFHHMCNVDGLHAHIHGIVEHNHPIDYDVHDDGTIVRKGEQADNKIF